MTKVVHFLQTVHPTQQKYFNLQIEHLYTTVAPLLRGHLLSGYPTMSSQLSKSQNYCQ